ncbi:sigma-54 interaction domain-containing protein [Paludifilum halophilum]|uniref:Sigma-54-dependent Fis family transcriptional regulator n=1 Tax=Paludifilum halophilum TaxID=1642702 RepID=A0A235B6N4_9BACL|nr:sigma 54-interacting transcriptional regulator [Paludifilum halophilum]OYD07964.1 sigma-54-dependent Fis family transcriptional regulator [Paludifilum halophilum]
MSDFFLNEGILREILHSIDEGIHVVNAEGVTVFYNDVASRLDNLAVEEVLGTHVLEVFPSLTPKTSTLLKVLETQESIRNQQQTYTNRYGKRIVTMNTTRPLKMGGRLIGALEVSKDITRIQELSEQVIDLQTRMRETGGKGKEQRPALYRFEQIVTQDPVLLQQIRRAEKAASTRSPVLVVGETGTGKELMVQSIHTRSPRRDQPFIAQNCAAIPSSLLEGILFGTVKGAFTGAEDRPGLFELAGNGSLFLDEIQAMPIDLQAKLLRVLEDRVIRRVGDVQMRPVDVRILAAMNEDPEKSVKEGRLREDLYYRIHVLRLQLPPLRERKGDIPLLTRYFLKKYNYRFERLVTGISPEVEKRFHQYDWPGNVRELEHTIEGAMNLVEGDRIDLEHLPRYLEPGGDSGGGDFIDHDLPLPRLVAQFEEKVIRKAMDACDGNIRQAAIRLGVPRQTLQYKLRKCRG